MGYKEEGVMLGREIWGIKRREGVMLGREIWGIKRRE